MILEIKGDSFTRVLTVYMLDTAESKAWARNGSTRAKLYLNTVLLRSNVLQLFYLCFTRKDWLYEDLQWPSMSNRSHVAWRHNVYLWRVTSPFQARKRYCSIILMTLVKTVSISYQDLTRLCTISRFCQKVLP